MRVLFPIQEMPAGRELRLCTEHYTLVILAYFSPNTWAQIFQRISYKELKSLRFIVC